VHHPLPTASCHCNSSNMATIKHFPRKT